MDSNDYRGCDELVRAVTGKTLVIGSKVYANNKDRRRLYRDAVGLDMEPGGGVDIVHDLEKPLQGKYDHIDCCSVLEHVQRPWLMAANIEALLKLDGTLLVCAPFSWRVHGYPSDYWRLTIDALPILFPRITWVTRHYLTESGVVPKVPLIKEKEETHIFRAEAVGFGRYL
jgi:hypothetical protein